MLNIERKPIGDEWGKHVKLVNELTKHCYKLCIYHLNSFKEAFVWIRSIIIFFEKKFCMTQKSVTLGLSKMYPYLSLHHLLESIAYKVSAIFDMSWALENRIVVT